MREGGNWESFRRNVALWLSARPLQFRADTLFPPDDLGQVTIAASFVIVKRGLTFPACQLSLTPDSQPIHRLGSFIS